MRKVITRLLPLTAVAAMALSPAKAQDLRDEVDGVWFGGYKNARGSSIQLLIHHINGIGKFEINSQEWESLGRAKCQYVYSYLSLSVNEIHLNKSYGTPEKCPSNFTFVMRRSGADDMTITFSGDMALEDAELSAGLRPLRDSDRFVKREGWIFLA